MISPLMNNSVLTAKLCNLLLKHFECTIEKFNGLPLSDKILIKNMTFNLHRLKNIVMVAQDKNWFQNFSERRNNTTNTLMDDFAISNMWDSVVEKYSDQAHFIYELLQNANDAKATKSSFELSPNGLYFKHNGIKNFLGFKS